MRLFGGNYTNSVLGPCSILGYGDNRYTYAGKSATPSGPVNGLPCAEQSGGNTPCASPSEPLSHPWQYPESVSNVCITKPPNSLSPHEYINSGPARLDSLITHQSHQRTSNFQLQIPDMSDTNGYPSPRSEGPRTSPMAGSGDEAAMDHQATPPSESVSKPRLAVKRQRDPPKNTDGLLFCDHPDCSKVLPTFRRPCEWK